MTPKNGTSNPLTWTIETGAPYPVTLARWAIIKVGGKSVYQQFVYDMDENGNRTVEQAEKNLLRTFALALRKVTEDDG